MTYLQTVVVNYNPDKLSPSELEKISRLGSRTLKAAQIFVAALPVMLSYPFFQRYFTKGLTLGGVKG
jgi:putative aldouronate transport system permease protein